MSEKILMEILGLPDLRYADLSYADLSDADMPDANLSDADMGGANLDGATLAGANLAGARGGVLQITGAHPYQAIYTPTPDGWHLTIGCWTGTTTELRELAAGDDWPDTRDPDEQEALRPVLVGIADLCDAHAARNQKVLDAVIEEWGNK